MTIKDSNGDDIAVITEFEHEEEMFRMERITTRLIFVIVIETLMFIAYVIFS